MLMSDSSLSIEALPLEARTDANAPRMALIEASAGTGKTYTLCGLYARYVAERGYMPDEILVVTFTEAAAGELSQRVRARLRETDATLRACGGEAALRGAENLRRAVARFDEAAIHTMHGFCQKLLRDFSFECAGAPEADIVQDASVMTGQSVDAFWRRAIAPAGPMLAALAAAGDFSRAFFLEVLAHMRKHPQAQLLPESALREPPQIEADLAAAFEAVRAQSGGIDALCMDIEATRMKQSHARDIVRAHAAAVRAALKSGVVAPAALEAMEAFTPEALDAGINRRFKNNTPPAPNEFSRACAAFCAVRALARVSLARAALEFAREDHRRRSQAQGVRTYDDLIDEVYAALQVGGNALAPVLRARYRVALIDEFQDTDPLQWGIFGSVFGGEDGPPLWLIGDPKQAIYRFRGADIFTYLKAADACDGNKHVLADNYRSSPGLIAGLNALFSLQPDAFLNEKIRYVPVRAAGNAPAFDRPGFNPAPIQIYAGGPARTTVAANEDIARSVALEISALLRAGVSAGDIAVLVRKSFQAQQVARALAAEGVACVSRGADPVFQSKAADMMTLWLALMDDMDNPTCAKSFAFAVACAYRTDANDCAAIAGPLPSPAQCAQWQVQWRRDGIGAALEACVRQTGLRAGALAAGQTRLLTDWAHLSQLLSQAEADGLSPEGLRAWFALQRENSDKRKRVNDELLARIDSDAVAVRVQTVHLSKGLEYPIVFAPFHWSGPEKKKKEKLPSYIDECGNFCVETGGWDAMPVGTPMRVSADAQSLGEEVRLLYVALTRAQSRLYLYWPALGRKRVGDTALGQALGVADESQIWPRLQQAQSACAALGAIALHPLEAPPPATQICAGQSPAWAQARVFAGRIAPVLHSASFSSITHKSASHVRPQDYDADTQDNAAAAQAADAIANFPQGASAGVFFHEIFERADYQNPDSWAGLIRERAYLAGLEGADLAAFHAMFARVIETPLDAPGRVRLCEIPAAARLHELGFCLPGKLPSPVALAEVFSAHAPQLPCGFADYLAGLPALALDGFLSGSIDALFCAQGHYWIADWKSNRLGENARAYTPEAIGHAMLQHAYYLQYHLYVCAADLWLRRRLPGYDYARDFGGVFYVFVRGVQDGVPASGVYFEKPSAACVRALQACLSGRGEGA